MSSLILASTSPYRRELLERLGWDFQAQAPAFDEDAAKSQAPQEPSAHAAFLALGKARSLAGPGKIVIGGDQLVAFENQILGKPKTFERAVGQLMAMSGKTHELHTAVCVVGPDGRRVEWVDVTRLKMRTLNESQIEESVRRDTPLNSAGSYKIERQGILLFEEIHTEDFTAIQGLPLLRLAQTLIGFGLIPFEQGLS
jgi:septum formation protein